MSFNQNQIRVVLRWAHIVLGLALLCYVYSPFSRYVAFQIFIKFLAIPFIVISGLWLWKPKIFNKLFQART